MNARFDPVDAFFRGVSSIGFRLPIALAAVLAAWLLNVAADPSNHGGTLGSAIGGIGLGSLGMIFVWAARGWPFLVGLCAVVAGLIFTYRFVADEGGKPEWFVIFACFGLYFSPMNFTRTDWVDARGRPVNDDSLFSWREDARPVIRRPWIRLIGLAAAAGALYWIVPPLVGSWVARRTTPPPDPTTPA